MSRLSELREFREKLVRADKIARAHDYRWLETYLFEAGLRGKFQIDHDHADCRAFVDGNSSEKIFADSIAHVDALIEQEKGKS